MSAAALSGLGSCASLQEIDANICGNGVREKTEDCDGYPDEQASWPVDNYPEYACGAPTEAGACRYICDYHGGYPKCRPNSGLACGFDRICRASQGLSNTPLSIHGSGAERLFSDDFDGDDRPDAVAVGASSIDIHFFATSGFIDRTVSTPTETRTLPGIGDINGDKRADLVLNLGAPGLGVLLSQEDRTLVTRSYPTRIIPRTTKQLVSLGSGAKDGVLLAFQRAQSDMSGTGALTLSRFFPTRVTGPGSSDVKFAPLVDDSFFGALPVPIAASAKPIFANSLCPHVAFVLEPSSMSAQLNILTCGDGDDWIDWKATKRQTQEFAGFKSWGGAFFADLNGDGLEDLAYGLTAKAGEGVVYARINDGTTLLPPVEFATESTDGCPVVGKHSLEGRPLAIGDLDGDGKADIVDESGIWFQNSALPRKCINGSGIWPNGGNWKFADIGDFDGNKIPDVLAARSSEPLIDFWGGVGSGSFHTLDIAPGFDVEQMVSGDFDGDAISDAILRPYTLDDSMMGMGGGSPKGPPELFVLFGEPFTPPNTPIRLGELDGIPTMIIAGTLTGGNNAGEPDPLTDLAVVTTPPMGQDELQLSVIAGHPRRRLLAPLPLTTSISLDVSSSRETPGQILISKFQAESCKEYLTRNDPNSTAQVVTPSTIAVLNDTGDSIWLAGCGPNGVGPSAGLPLVGEPPMIPPPMQMLAEVRSSDASGSLGAFSGALTGNARLYWANASESGTSFSLSQEPINGPGKVLSLPQIGKLDPFDIPFRFIDIDGNGERDVALTSGGDGSQIIIYWSRPKNPEDPTQMPLRQDDTYVVQLDSGLFRQAPTGDLGNTTSDRPIRDFVFMNLDKDTLKELVVLTERGIFIAGLDAKASETPTFKFNEVPFYETPAGRALLAIDANSDGVDDLLLADDRKLQLFMGKEAGR